ETRQVGGQAHDHASPVGNIAHRSSVTAPVQGASLRLSPLASWVASLQGRAGNRAAVGAVAAWVQRDPVKLPSPECEQLINAAKAFLQAAHAAYTASQGPPPAPLAPIWQDEYTAWEQLLNVTAIQAAANVSVRAHLQQLAAGPHAAQAAGFNQAANRIPPNVTFLGCPDLVQHIGNLVGAAQQTLQGLPATGGEDAGRLEGPATSQCMGVAALAGMTFGQLRAAIPQAANFNKFSQSIGRGPGRGQIGGKVGRSRFEWLFNDGSMIAIDVPGEGVGERFWVSMLPHAERRAGNPNSHEHLSDNGLVVPATSHPAHIQFDWRHNSLRDYIHSQGGEMPAYKYKE
ncbi:MAG TPA: hypothetical protein VME46_11490, partial [Acidimicrobiales bacterium]|nr:hypothetical protein [Acidimicrobiales bacterium]